MERDVFAYFLKRLGELPGLKTLTGIFIWLLSVLYGDFRPAYGAVIVLIVVDWATGIYYAWRDPASRITSTKLKSGAFKLAIYGVLLSIGHLCSLVEFAAIVQALIEGYIIMTESISVLENVQKITVLQNVQIPMLDKIMSMIQGQLKGMEGGGRDGRL